MYRLLVNGNTHNNILYESNCGVYKEVWFPYEWPTKQWRTHTNTLKLYDHNTINNTVIIIIVIR